MHESIARSPVSDALAKFATSPLTQHATESVAAAGRAITQARASAAGANNVERHMATLLQSQQSSPNDARVRAWVLGATFAKLAVPSSATPVLAAVIAIGDKLAACDEEIATAAAVGIEAAARILSAVDSDEYRARWNVASSIGVLGAALAVSRLLRLDEGCTRHALGIAATQAAGLSHNAGESMEAIETGKAAADAIEASLLAKHGLTSAATSIDGRRGLAALMAYRFNAMSIIAGLGTQWVARD
jgi:MmgE/PrpD N-terminal domain